MSDDLFRNTPFIQGDVAIDTDMKVILFNIKVNRASFEFALPYGLSKKIAEGILKQLDGELNER